ncbi:MAG: type VI secretion system protein TssA, partial [Solimonas sp.]
DGTAAVAAVASGSAPAVAGPVRGIQDIVVRIDEICAYYIRHEPSSPVPLLLERAKRLVGKDFLAIVEDLAPAGLSEARAMRGGTER